MISYFSHIKSFKLVRRRPGFCQSEYSTDYILLNQTCMKSCDANLSGPSYS